VKVVAPVWTGDLLTILPVRMITKAHDYVDVKSEDVASEVIGKELLVTVKPRPYAIENGIVGVSLVLVSILIICDAIPTAIKRAHSDELDLASFKK